MKIVLKRDWDIQISPPLSGEKFKGHYGGRDKEVEMLTNELLRGKKGSILISGYRGVGKTSLVYKALWRAHDRDNDIIFILLNSAQLEIDPNKGIEPTKIMENLIRRLFSTIYNEEYLNSLLQDKLMILYRKAIASDFQKSEIIICKDEDVTESLKETKIDFILSEKNLIFIISWSLATLIQFVPVLPWDGMNKIAPLLLAFPVPFGLNVLYRKHLISKKILSKRDTAEELYKFDKNLGNLEFDLEKLHREISNEGKKLIYVIDELDKLDAQHIDEILNYFKNFFTLSDAIFIFIGGEEIYSMDTLDKKPQKDNLYRNKNYTYFSSKYFIARPLWEDLKGFLYSIIHKISEHDKEEFEVLGRALCFESKNDFYDIKYHIKDRINEFDEKDQPAIDLALSKKDIQKARYHKAITIVFEEKYMLIGPSKWKENEALSRNLFDHAFKIYSMDAGCLIEDPTGEDTISEMLRDFNNLMHRIGAFEIEKTERRANPRNNYQNRNDRDNEQIYVIIYRYIGNIPNDPPCHFNQPTEFEMKFVNGYHELTRYVLSLVNAFNIAKGKWEITEEEFIKNLKNYKIEREVISNSIFETLITHYNEFNLLNCSANEYSNRRDETEKNLRGIESQIVALKRMLPNIILNMIKQLCQNIDDLRSLKDSNKYFSFLDESQRSELRDFRIISTKDQLRQLIFLSESSQFEKMAKEIKSKSSTHRAILLSEKEINQNIKGRHVVEIGTPEMLGSSLQKVLKDIKIFYSNKEKLMN